MVLHKSGSFLGAFSNWRFDEHLYKQMYTNIKVLRPERDTVSLSLTPMDKLTFVQKVYLNPNTTTMELVKELETSGTSFVKIVFIV